MREQVILLQPEAPTKPRPGEACNGCGVCCSWQPCPLGMLLSRKRHGACAALIWEPVSARYRCGVISAPADQIPLSLRWFAPVLARLGKRWIAAGAGCDSDLQAEAPSP